MDDGRRLIGLDAERADRAEQQDNIRRHYARPRVVSGPAFERVLLGSHDCSPSGLQCNPC